MYKRILIIRTGALGDILLIVPTIQCLRQSFPDSRLTLWTRRPEGEFLCQAGLIHEWQDIESADLIPLFSERESQTPVSQCSWDLVLCYAASSESPFVRNLQRLARGEFVAWPGKPPGDQVDPAWKFLLDSLHGVEGIGRLEDFVFPVPSGWVHSARQALGLPQGDTKRFVAVHPGSGGKEKCWPASRFLQLAKRLSSSTGAEVVFIQGPGDQPVAPDTTRLDGLTFSSLCSPSLHLLAGFLSISSLYVGNDSGVSHLAGLLGIPTIVIFGPTDQRVWRPYGRAVHTIHADTECRPCNESRQQCSSIACLEDVSVQQVLSACGSALEESRAG